MHPRGVFSIVNDADDNDDGDAYTRTQTTALLKEKDTRNWLRQVGARLFIHTRYKITRKGGVGVRGGLCTEEQKNRHRVGGRTWRDCTQSQGAIAC